MLELRRPHSLSFPDWPKIRQSCEEEEDKLKYRNPSPSYHSVSNLAASPSPSPSYHSVSNLAASPSPSYHSAASSSPSHDSAASSSPSHESAASPSPSYHSADLPQQHKEALSKLKSLSLDAHKEAWTKASCYKCFTPKRLRATYNRSKAENYSKTSAPASSNKRVLYSRKELARKEPLETRAPVPSNKRKLLCCQPADQEPLTPALANPEKEASNKRYPDSPFNSGTSTLPVNPEPLAVMMAKTQLRCQKAALEYYNMMNNADYEIAGPFHSKSFMKDVYWLHCNFMAKPRNGDIFPKLFFAEVHCPRQKKPGKGGPWAVTACLVVEGKTTDGCNHCHGIVHPVHGFSQGNRKNQRKGRPPIIDCCLRESVKRIRRADIALEYYNKENGTDYEVVYTMRSSGFSSDGDCNYSANPDSTWYHFNFLAWRNVDGKYTRTFFFAEMFGDVSRGMEYLTVTACLPLKGRDSSCAACSGEVIHPAHGFLKGIRKPVPYEFPSPFDPYPSNAITNPYCIQAKTALEYYNQKHGTEYKVVGALGCHGLRSDGNFTAMETKSGSSVKNFFAEMFGVPKYHNPIVLSFTWKVTACIILEEGRTRDSCYLCPDEKVIHPTHGFVKGLEE